MATARQYQVRAKVCLELAKEAKDIYARDAMLELAEEFKKAGTASLGAGRLFGKIL